MVTENLKEPTDDEIFEANRELEQELEIVDLIVKDIDKEFIKQQATGNEIIDTINKIIYNRSVIMHGKHLADKYRFDVVFVPRLVKKGMRQYHLHITSGTTIMLMFVGNPVSALRDSNFIYGMDRVVKLFPSMFRESALMLSPGKSISFDSFSEISRNLRKAKEEWIEDTNKLIPDFRIKKSHVVSEIIVVVEDVLTKIKVEVKGSEANKKEMEVQARIKLTELVRKHEMDNK